MKFFIIPLMLLFLGCSAKNNSVVFKSDFNIPSSTTFYANLSQVSGNQWQFTNINTVKGDVRLNDMQPTFNINNKPCVSANGTEFVFFWQDNCNISRFRKSGVDWGETFKTHLYTVFGLGIGLVFGLHNNYTYFDEPTFREAIQSAVKNSDIGKHIADMEKQANEYVELLNQKTELCAKTKDKLIKTMKLSFNVQTGYLIGKTATDKILSNILDVDLQCYLPAQKNIIDDDQKEKKISELKNKTIADYDIIFSSTFIRQDGAVYQIPEQTIKYRENTSAITVQAGVYIDTALYPKMFFEDKSLSVSFDGDNIIFSNKTNSFIQILSIAVYFEDDISVYSLNNLYELAPHSSNKGGAFRIHSVANKVINDLALIKSEHVNTVRSKQVDFGFAIKYKIIDQNKEITLLKRGKGKLL